MLVSQFQFVEHSRRTSNTSNALVSWKQMIFYEQ